MTELPYSDIDILNALDCCMERPDRACRRCPLFDAEDYDNCDNLEWWTYQIIMEQRREIERLKANEQNHNEG